MPYKTIQQNFANGELNPKMQGRSDVDMYYKSAQKMREVVTTPYGGFVRRPGTTKIGDLTEYYEEQGSKGIRLFPFVFNNEQSYLLALTDGKIDIFRNDLLEESVEAPKISESRIQTLRYAQSADTCFFVHPDFNPLKLVRGGATVDVESGRIENNNFIPTIITIAEGTQMRLGRMSINYPINLTSESLEIGCKMNFPNPGAGSPVRTANFKVYDQNDRAILTFSIYEKKEVGNTRFFTVGFSFPGKYASNNFYFTSDADQSIYFKAIFNRLENKIYPYYKLNDGEWNLINVSGVEISSLTSLTRISFEVKDEATTPPVVNSIELLDDTYIKNGNEIKWTYSLGNTASWTLSDFLLESPSYNFGTEEFETGSTTAEPDKLDGAITITLGSSINRNVVGQYFEGNGARVKISAQDGTKLKGYTVIGFYTTDKLEAGKWKITNNYEPVWSEERGWPSTVTFHQGRLWFGGSKSRPQTVWGSKVGLFNKFDPSSGYDNDAIEFTLDTESLNKITDIYSAKGLYIFTLGGEFVCQTSYGEPITPKNVSALKQSSNGSWENTQPVELEGSVIFVERKGQALMNFAYLDQDSYASSNASLINSHLINQPEDLDIERNNLTQQTNYVYIVNKDGSMCVVNLLAAQGITGGFTLWNTQGKVKSVCVLPDATYIAVERELQGNYKKHKIFLEKLDWDILTDCTQSFVYSGGIADTIPGDNTDFALKDMDIIANGKYLCSATVSDTGTLKATKTFPAGTISWGYPFRSYVQSNFLEVAQMGSGVGKLKRLASMVVRVLDTPEVTINGETQKGTGKGVEDIHFYGIGDWDEKPTWEFTQNTPYKFNVLAAQMDLNYQLSNESY